MIDTCYMLQLLEPKDGRRTIKETYLENKERGRLYKCSATLKIVPITSKICIFVGILLLIKLRLVPLIPREVQATLLSSYGRSLKKKINKFAITLSALIFTWFIFIFSYDKFI